MVVERFTDLNETQVIRDFSNNKKPKYFDHSNKYLFNDEPTKYD